MVLLKAILLAIFIVSIPWILKVISWLFAYTLVFMEYWIFKPIYYGQILRRLYLRQNRKLKRYLRKSPVFSKLYYYATLYGIKIEKGYSRNSKSDWAVCVSTSTVKVYCVKDVYRLERQEKGVYSLAHEIGHIKRHRRQPTQDYCENMKGINTDIQINFRQKFETWLEKKQNKSFKCSCFWDELLSWIYGKNFIKEAGASIDEKKYWQTALDCAHGHYNCPLWPFECPKYRVIQRLERKIREKIEKLK